MSRLSANKRALLKALLADSAEPAIVQRIPRRPADAPTPLSFAQQRLWFLDRFDSGGQQYALCSAMRLSGSLDQAALSRSLSTIMRRHETLRTTIGMIGDQPVQVVAPEAEIALPEIDLSGYDEAERESQIAQRVAAEGRRSFDLAQGPLVRAMLLRLGSDDQILLIVMHHIISDGWSMSIFLRELAVCYRAYTADATALLPELPIQYADYAIWQREWLQGDALDEQLGYWRKQLADASTVLELPTDRPRPARQTFNGARSSFTLSPQLTAQVAALSQQEGATLFMTTLAAFQVLLSRYTGQDDLLVGSPIANRTRAEVEPLIGFFVNTLVLRGDLRGRPCFREVLRRVRETALGAYAHQDLPFEKLVEELQPERHLSRSPLIQVMFILQNTPGEVLDLSGLTATRLDVSSGMAAFDLTLQLTESADGLQGLCEYNTDLFDAATIARLAGHYATLLQAIVADPERAVADLPLLTNAEQEWLEGLNGPQIAYPLELLPAWFSAQARRAPDQTALIFPGTGEQAQRLSYRELDQRSNQLARHLQALGVGPDSRVGLCMERSLDLVIGLLGILKAGGAYVPLDPTHPAERLGYILDDAQIALLVTQADLVKKLSEAAAGSIQLVRLDTDAARIAELSTEPPVSGAGPDSLAYMIYTSGTTGQPKGVQVEHRSLINTLRASQQTFGFRAGDVMPWLAAVTFDIALFELFNPLLAGGTTLILTHDDVLNLPRLAEHLRDITLIHAVPSLMRQLVQTARESASLHAYDQLRQIFVGGEAVPPALVADLHTAFPNAQIQILYGPTEATIICTHHEVTPDQAISSTLIGKPLPNVQVRVYDMHRQRVPIGVAGELYIGGVGVTRGYWQQDQLSAAQFVTIDDQRWYRAGDLVRYRADGSLEFVGRSDHQVKVRGFRIELGEIEATLSRHPAVRQALVVPHITGDDTRLVAYVVGKEQGNKGAKEQEPVGARRAVPGTTEQPKLDTQELRTFLRDRLPEYMLPATWMVLDELPLNAHGKVDRKQLPAPEWRSAADEAAFVAPRDELEELLAQIWIELLGLQRVGMHDNFFELGGHSLLATQLATRILHTFQVELPLRCLFEAPTIAGLHAVIEDLLIEKLASLSEAEVEQLASSVHSQSAYSW